MDPERAADRFPLVVAAVSTVTALLLFFSGTVPAMQEARHLRRAEASYATVHDDLWSRLDADAERRMSLRVDLQNLLVELDHRGVYAGAILDPADPNRDGVHAVPPGGPAPRDPDPTPYPPPSRRPSR